MARCALITVALGMLLTLALAGGVLGLFGGTSVLFAALALLAGGLLVGGLVWLEASAQRHARLG
jgi:uncharacterized membrane protein